MCVGLRMYVVLEPCYFVYVSGSFILRLSSSVVIWRRSGRRHRGWRKTIEWDKWWRMRASFHPLIRLILLGENKQPCHVRRLREKMTLRSHTKSDFAWKFVQCWWPWPWPSRSSHCTASSCSKLNVSDCHHGGVLEAITLGWGRQTVTVMVFSSHFTR